MPNDYSSSSRGSSSKSDFDYEDFGSDASQSHSEDVSISITHYDG